jgi:negative regulator of flagellin synthesis FlgM
MQIRPTSTSNIQNTTSINSRPKTAAANNTTGSVPVDQLDFSPQAQALSAAASTGDVRMDRIADIRAQIASGKYDTAEKIDTAVGRMLDQFA